MRTGFKKSLTVALAVFGMAAAGLAASAHPWLFSFHQTAQPPAAPLEPRPAVRPIPAPESPGSAVARQVPVDREASPVIAPVPLLAQAACLRFEVLGAKQSASVARTQLARAQAWISNPPTGDQLRSIRKARELYREAIARYSAALEQYQSALQAQAEDEASGGVSGGLRGSIEAQESASSLRTERPAENGDAEYSVLDTDWGDSEPRFVIVTKGSDRVTMSGSEEDAEHARALRGKIPADFIWFERDEKSYVIRNQATVDRAKSFWAPEEELGKKQAKLGREQEALGRQQEELSRKMEDVRVKLPDMSAELDKLKGEMKQLSAEGGTVEQVGRLQSEMGELQSRIGQIESEAGRRQGDIGREQGELGRRQGELGRQQGELGREQGELARAASKQMKQLFDDAIARGLAQPE